MPAMRARRSTVTVSATGFLRRLGFGLVLVDQRLPAARHDEIPRCSREGDVMSRTHATASALSYGMRYLLRLIFNIAVGEGDDGNKAGAQQQLSRAPSRPSSWPSSGSSSPRPRPTLHGSAAT